MKNLDASEDKMRRLNDQLKMKQQLYEERRQTIANYNKDVEMAQFEREREARRPKTAPTGDRPSCPAALGPAALGPAALGPAALCPRDTLPSALCLATAGPEPCRVRRVRTGSDPNDARRRGLVLLCAVGPAAEACERQPVLRAAD